MPDESHRPDVVTNANISTAVDVLGAMGGGASAKLQSKWIFVCPNNASELSSFIKAYPSHQICNIFDHPAILALHEQTRLSVTKPTIDPAAIDRNIGVFLMNALKFLTAEPGTADEMSELYIRWLQNSIQSEIDTVTYFAKELAALQTILTTPNKHASENLWIVPEKKFRRNVHLHAVFGRLLELSSGDTKSQEAFFSIVLVDPKHNKTQILTTEDRQDYYRKAFYQMGQSSQTKEKKTRHLKRIRESIEALDDESKPYHHLAQTILEIVALQKARLTNSAAKIDTDQKKRSVTHLSALNKESKQAISPAFLHGCSLGCDELLKLGYTFTMLVEDRIPVGTVMEGLIATGWDTQTYLKAHNITLKMLQDYGATPVQMASLGFELGPLIDHGITIMHILESDSKFPPGRISKEKARVFFQPLRDRFENPEMMHAATCAGFFSLHANASRPSSPLTSPTLTVGGPIVRRNSSYEL